MRKEHRAMLCLAVELVILWEVLLFRLEFLPGMGTVSAFAEGGMQLTVEVAGTSPTSTQLPSPDPETSAPTPSPTPQQAEAADVFLVEVIADTPEPTAEISRRILIYHTHTWEAYRQVPDDPYRETEKWRTKDDDHNVVAVGKALAASLRALGFAVVHDTSAFEPPNLDAAYARSLTMLEDRLAAGERYDLYIDLHRDALSSSSTIRKTVNIGGEDVARFMVLVGKGTTGGYQDKPDWEANLDIADRITSSLNGQCEGLARDVKTKTGRFNQHVAPCCVLLECGVNTNTLEEVLRGVPYLAQAIADALAGTNHPPEGR